MEKRDKITRICVWSVISTLAILSGLFLFIWLMRIYIGNIDNTPIYTRENVVASLLQILAVLILFVVAVIGGGILSYFKKLDDKNVVKGPLGMKYKAIVGHIQDLGEENPEYKKLIAEKKKRLIEWTVVLIIELVLALFIFLYLINNKNFPLDGNATETMINLAVHTLPFLFVIGIVQFIGVFLEELSYKKSIEIAKGLLKEYRNKEEKNIEAKNKYIVWGIRGAVVLASIVLIIVGLAMGGADFVLRNAITICSACIGLG